MQNIINLSNTTPAAPVGKNNVLWQNDGSWVGKTITIAGTGYSIKAVASPTSLTLNSSAGTQTGAAFSVTTTEPQIKTNTMGLLNGGMQGIYSQQASKVKNNSAISTRQFNCPPPAQTGSGNTSGVGQVFPTGRS